MSNMTQQDNTDCGFQYVTGSSSSFSSRFSKKFLKRHEMETFSEKTQWSEPSISIKLISHYSDHDSRPSSSYLISTIC